MTSPIASYEAALAQALSEEASTRDLLEKLATQTGGRYYRPTDAAKLGDDISYSDAGITVRETKDLWDMPIVFFMALLLCCAEWLLRRRWGVV